LNFIFFFLDFDVILGYDLLLNVIISLFLLISFFDSVWGFRSLLIED